MCWEICVDCHGKYQVKGNICFRQATRGICCFISVISYAAVLIAIYRIVSSSLMLFQDGKSRLQSYTQSKVYYKELSAKGNSFLYAVMRYSL